VRLETYGIATVPSDVRALFDRQERPEGRWDWFEILAATTLSGREEACIVVLAEAGGGALAAMPLVQIDGQVVRSLTSPFTTLFCPPLGGEDNARQFGTLLAARVGASLRLDALDGSGGEVGALAEGLAAGRLVVLRFRHFANWFELIQDFATYWNSRGSKLKATVKRKAAPLLREDRLGFEELDMSARWREGADIYQAIYAKSWKPDEPHPRFIEALLGKLGPPGTARLAIARIDGVPAAAQIWLVRDGRATIFKLAHDPAFDRQSPGTLLTHWMLARLHERDAVRHVDFGRGDDAYKRLWLSSARDRIGILAANPKSLKGIVTIIFDILPSRFAAIVRAGRPALT
jgi:CelD/BcsL family acetyltransferase involved in cellulose biosynthesis